MTDAGAQPRRMGAGLGCLLFIVVFVVSLVGGTVLFAWLDRTPVRGAIPPGFPMIAMAASAGGARVPFLVTGEHLARFKKDHPDHSFLLADGKERELAERLASSDPPYAAGLYLEGLQVDDAGNGRQRIAVNAPWNSDVTNLGVYETGGREITPLYRRSGNDFVAGIRSVVLAFVLAFATLFVVAIADKVRAWRAGR